MFIRRLVGWVEGVRNADAALLYVHLLVVAVFEVHAVKVLNHFGLDEYRLLVRLLFGLLDLNGKVNLGLETPNGVVE